MNIEQVLQIDQTHLWHPYADVTASSDYLVTAAHGAKLTLAKHGEVLDGMASWWACIHGYNHPKLNEAGKSQLDAFAHVMFGGLTHQPAAALAEQLMAVLPAGLERFFFTDSGSVSIEVAMKMALQYQMAKGRPQRSRFAALSGAYHGDTFGAMSLCDPNKSMHHLFYGTLAKQTFLPAPTEQFDPQVWARWEAMIRAQQDELAAVVVEPLLQGAGGMRPYDKAYLHHLRTLCSELDLLLVADEIATGFGRTGEWFACKKAAITPDIICIGKALTGGYMTMAAAIATPTVANAMAASPAGVLMHGPTFMANPLACRIASASLSLLHEYNWRAHIDEMHSAYQFAASDILALEGVAGLRLLANIIAVDLNETVDMKHFSQIAVAEGIWLRPFGRMVYMMPPFLLASEEKQQLIRRFQRVLKRYLSEAAEL